MGLKIRRPRTATVGLLVTGGTLPARGAPEPGRLPVRQAGLHAAAAGPGGPELRLLRLPGLPAAPRWLMPALRRHLSHCGVWVLQGKF